jgi:hypothetical protein
VWKAFSGGTADSNITSQILANGSAEFKGAVFSDRPGAANGCFIGRLNGDTRFIVSANGSVSCGPSANPTITLYADTGNATFAGNVDAPNINTRNVQIQLEDDNYYPVTDENDQVTYVYNGETLDVKETLLTMTSRLNARDAKIEDLYLRLAKLEAQLEASPMGGES